MAELSTLARPYARAAFEFARGSDSLATWSTQLEVLAAVVAQPQVASLVSSPAHTATEKADGILNVCGDAIDASVTNFVRVVADNKRLPLLPEIYRQFEAHKAALEQSVEVEVITAFELDQQDEEKLVQSLKAKLEQDVSITAVVDKSLLGGIVVRAGDLVFDGSIRGRLAKLAESLHA